MSAARPSREASRRPARIVAAVIACALSVAGEGLGGTARAQTAEPAATGASVGSTPLDGFLAGLRTLRVTFTQQLIDGHGHALQSGSGTLIVQRPGRFRWEIRPAGDEAGQLVVADGKNLWFYDRDLAQVTVKPADAALTATPALLLAGGGDIRQSFDVRPLPKSAGLEWVAVTPKAKDADFREARLGFAAGELKRMVLADKLGQSATLVFGPAVRNGPVSPAEVGFTPPAGVDVIGTPAA